MYDRMVVPVDGSEAARHAARRGLELARAFDAAVEVLHVVDRSRLGLARSGDEQRRVRARGQEALAEIEELAAALDYPVRTTLAEGTPAAEITEFAREQDADLVVVGRQGLTGLGRRLLGGVTEQVLHRSDLPVFVVPALDDAPDEEVDYARVLLPTDGSENAERAIPHGVAIATRYGAAVHVLNVVDLQAAGGVFDAGGLERQFVDRLEARGREAVDSAATQITDAAPELTVEPAVERTTSHRGIVAGVQAYVEEHDVGLVVMGSHGRSNLERQVMGSVAATVLRTVDVPVLVVPRPAR